MKRLLEMSLGLGIVLASTQARAAVPAPKFLQGHPHWFNNGLGSDNVGNPGMPIVLHLDNSASNNLNNANAVAAMQAAANQWVNIACTTVNFTFDTPSAAYHNGFSGGPGTTYISFNDPANDLGGLTLAATITPYNGASTETVNGITWHQINEFVIVFAKGWTWATRNQTLGGQCSGASDIQSVAVHEIGHGLGYAHSCESGESCVDPLLQTSIMYWQEGPCQDLEANAWDINMQSVSYGFGASADFSSDTTAGGLPLAVNFTPVLSLSSSSILGADWTFGDGTSLTTSSASGLVANHSYLTEGRYSVGMNMTANAPQCGGANFSQKVQKVDYITACNTLAAKFHFSASGNTVHFFNDTLGATSGCLDTLDWDFGDGSAHGKTQQPIHTYAKGGTYTVSLVAGGAAGTSPAATESVSTGGKKGGCSVDGVPTSNSVAAIGALALALAMSLVTVARRKTGA